MNLLEKAIDVINKDEEKIKTVTLTQKNKKEFDKCKTQRQKIGKAIEIIRERYDKHINFNLVDEIEDIKLKDKEPTIIKKKDETIIKFYSIRSRNPIDNQKIIDITQKIIYDCQNKLTIDFTNCGGGNIEVFCRAFAPLIGTGLIFSTKNIYAYFRGETVQYSPKKLSDKRIIPKITIPITLIISENTFSSAEYISMILLASHPKIITKIGKESGGYLSVTKEKSFSFENQKYYINFTVSLIVIDQNGKKYNGKIK
jgi:hypothetical protein